MERRYNPAGAAYTGKTGGDSAILAVRIIVPLFVLAAAGALTFWLIASRPVAKPQDPQEKVWTLSAAPVERISLTPKVEVFGEIVAGSSVDLRPLVAGRVVEVGPALIEGGVVRQGDLLVQIDRFEYDAIVQERGASLAEIKARLDQTAAELRAERALVGTADQQVLLRQRDFKRRADLFQRGTGTQKSVDDAELAVNEALQQLTQRRQTVARLEAQSRQQQAQIQQAEVALLRAARDLQNTRLTAPFDGYILEASAAVGRIMSTGDPVGRIVDAGSLEARFQLTDSDYARLLGSQEGLLDRLTEVIWQIGNTTLSFDARIRRVGAEIDAASGGVFLFARLENAGLEMPVRPGAFVKIAVPDRRYDDVIRLPAGAVEGGEAVYKVVDGRLERTRISILRRFGGDVLIVPDQASALPDGVEVVTQRFPEIGPGLRVNVR